MTRAEAKQLEVLTAYLQIKKMENSKAREKENKLVFSLFKNIHYQVMSISLHVNRLLKNEKTNKTIEQTRHSTRDCRAVATTEPF